MPKYRERERVRPVPGAFGLERSKEEWERRNRPMSPYLERRGFYADHLYILVDEEYGYDTHLWVYPGTAEELVDDWMSGRTPWRMEGIDRMAYPADRGFRGEVDPVSFQTTEQTRDLDWAQRRLELVHRPTGQVFDGFQTINDFDGAAHVHMEEDSHLRIGFYEIDGLYEPSLTIHVLDALAAIR